MELFRGSEALLRSSQPLLPVLAPSAYRVPASRAAAPWTRHRHAPAQSTPSRWQVSRAFTTYPCRRQEQPTNPDPSPAAPTQANTSAPAPSTPRSSQSSIDGLLDVVSTPTRGSLPKTASRASRFDIKRVQPANSSSQPLTHGGNSLADVFKILGNPSAPKQAAQRNSARGATGFQSDPTGLALHRAPPMPEDEPSTMKLGSSLGKTVPVRDSDVARAFRSLDILCSRNSVRKDFQRQRFHERPGLKRKRLKSERWRKNFKIQFRATVAMVQKMKRQGW